MQQLHDVVLPEAVSYFPTTAPWLVVFLVLFALLATGLVSWVRHERRNRYRKKALARLDDLWTRRAYREIPALLKQTTLVFRDRGEVASLTGDAWLRFLDRSYGGDGFTRGPGRVLPELAYGRDVELDQEDFLELIRDWIRTHDARA